MLHLYEHPLSPYAQKVKLALYEKGIEFDASTPDIFGGSDERFVRSSPRREVPSLLDDDCTVFDSTIILEYLEDKWPEPPMLPSGPAERARVRMLEEMCDTTYEAINWAVAEILVFGRARGELAERLLGRAREQIAGVHAWLERQLGERDFFNGGSFGWGDAAVFPHVSGSAALAGVAPPGGSRLAAWLTRVADRPSVKKVTASAMQAMAGFQNLGPVVESGAFRREYRDHRLEWMLRSGGTQIVLDGVAKGNVRFSIELE
jgi:glutathione S-transferase/RNA polymerase-associated protein